MRGSKRAGISRKVKIEDKAGRQRHMTVHPSRGSWVVFGVSACWRPVLSHKQVVDVTCLLWWRFEAWEVQRKRRFLLLRCKPASHKQRSPIDPCQLGRSREARNKSGMPGEPDLFAGRLANKTQPHNDNIDA